jgi:phosphatidylglycerol---prolipoprotein diacylglyceryl transferase
MLPIIHIGPLAVQFPGLILLIGLWIGLEFVERQAVRFNLPGGKLSTLALVALGAGILGARIVFAAQYPHLFEGSPLSLLALSPQLLNLPGGLIVAVVAGLAYAQRNCFPLWSTLDALVVLFAVLLITIAISNLASGDAYGAASTLPWSVNLWGSLRHPSQLYEALAGLLALILIWPAENRKFFICTQAHPGSRWWTFLALTSASRLFLEYFRGDSSLVFGEYRLAQLIAWLLLALSLWNLNRHFNFKKPDTVEMETS